MELQHLLLFLLFTTSLFLFQNPVVASWSLTPSPSLTPIPSPKPLDGKDFIKKSCQSTSLPHFCYKALSRYADKVGNDPVKLALASISYTLPKAQAVKDYTEKLNGTKLDPGTAAAVAHCVECLDSAVDEIQSALNVMKTKKKYNIFDLELLLSSAINDEDMCAEGFEEDMDDNIVVSDVKSDVVGRNWEVRMLTVISRAMVTHLY